MQKVSQAYRDSMSSPLRERAFIKISFGLINQELQNNARVISEGYTDFSFPSNIFTKEEEEKESYATLEENFTTVDGLMPFLPRSNSVPHYIDNGVISENLISDGAFEMEINLNVRPITFKGITINFGENYPLDFDITADNGQTYEYRGNTEAVFYTEAVLEETTRVGLIVYRMKNEHSRFRVRSIQFGYGLVFGNEDVLSSSLDSYVSPIGADVPQIDFMVKVKNYDKYFNVDNPNSAINFFETGQEMSVSYGYQLPESNEIEWVKGAYLLCSEWESDDSSATIRCQDILRNMESEYYRGEYSVSSISYYDLATSVMEDAGVESYYIDPRLRNLYTQNPLPRVSHKQALQIIANASRCVLSQTIDGKIQIKSSFVPELSLNSNGETTYSNLSNILNDIEISEYASLSTDYTTSDGSMFFLPRGSSDGSIIRGFISSQLSDTDCEFTTNPIVTIVQESQCSYRGLTIVFGESLPSSFEIRTFNDNEPVDNYIITNTERITIVRENFDDFDTMEIEFLGTEKPLNRIVINHFSFGDVTDFTMERNDMMSSPKIIKKEQVKQVSVVRYLYQKNSQEDNLLSETVMTSNDQVMTFYVNEPSYDYRVQLDESNSGVSIVESGSYFITVKFTVSGEHELSVYGHKYKIVESEVTRSLNERGTVVKWENPLISTLDMANDLADWLSDYYSSNIEYEYDTRGNPELETNDVIYQENEFVGNMKVQVYRQTLNFKQGFSGKLTTRRWEG